MNANRFLLWAAAAAAVLVPPTITAAPAAQPNAAQEASAGAVRDQLGVQSVALAELDLPNQIGDGFTVTVSIRGMERRLLLKPHSLRSPDFQLMGRDAEGKLIPDTAPVPPPCTVRGTIEGLPGSEVAGSLSDGQLDAVLRLDAESDGQVDHLSVWDQITMSFLYPRPDWRFVDIAATGAQTGSFVEPYHQFAPGYGNTPIGGTLWVQPGSYLAGGLHSRAMTVEAPLGGVTLGN